MSKQPRFGQLDRLADYRDEWEPRQTRAHGIGIKWKRNNQQRKKPTVQAVDEFISDDADAP